MEASKEVALYKKENALPIVDKMREKELILKNSKYVEDVVIGEYYVNFYNP
ncbi:MAG: chorismate mutase [Christensenellales bacterium]